MTSRRAAALLAGLVAAAGLLGALAARQGLFGGTAEAREARLRSRASAAIRRDADRLAGMAARLARSPGLLEIVEGGSGDVRPGALFSLLGGALPREPGWGALLLDRNGEAVAWAGEPGDLPGKDAPRAGPFGAAFRVTELTLVHETVVGRTAETRGLLVVTRRLPTGVVRPDLLEARGGLLGATSRRVRIRASSVPGRLLAVDVEPAEQAAVEDDVRRAAALPWALSGAVAALLLGVAAGAPARAAVAARLVLLLGLPRAETGPFASIPGDPTGLLATPVDVALTGLVALVVLRSALSRGKADPLRGAARAAAAAAAILLAAAPVGFGLLVGRTEPSLLLGLGLFAGPAEEPVASAGLVALSGLALGLAALLAGRCLRPGGALLAAGGLGAALAAGGHFAAPSAAWVAVLVLGGCALAAGLSRGAAAFPDSDLLSRAVVAALILGSGALLVSGGAAAGRIRLADERLEAAADRTAVERELLEEEGPSGFEERVARPSLAPLAPAGRRTIMSDLARALWMRGRDGSFPEPGDLLTVRDEGGRVLSSFGRLRPGDEDRGTAVGLRLPVEGTVGVLTHVPWPAGDDVDPLLVSVLGEPVHGLKNVERSDFDSAGFPLGRGRAENAELSAALLSAARRAGAARGTERAAGRRFRVDVRRGPTGFVAWRVEVPTPLFTIGSAVAATETTLPFALLVVLGPQLGALAGLLRRAVRRRGEGAFRTFRGRLALALLVSGAIPLAGGAVMVRTALDRASTRATERNALQLLTEGRRLLEERVGGTPSPSELNRAASVVGVDLLLYRDGLLAAASRAVPVAAGLAPERLPARVAAALGDGASEAAATRAPVRDGGRRIAEAAVTLSREERTALAVVLGEDPAGREAADGLVLLAAGVTLLALALGGRGALALSKPVEELVVAAERIGAGSAPAPIPVPETVDLARLVEAFGAMSERIRERTELLEREREAAVSVLASLSPAAVLYREETGRVLVSNPAADALLPAGESLFERLSGAPFAPLAAALARPRPFESRVTLPVDGGEKVLRVVAADLPPDADGKRALLLLEDLTDFTRAERLEAWVEAARAVAHDIKNPLTPIRLTAERLARSAGKGAPPNAGRIGEAAATILRQVDLLTERTARLSRFASPAAPRRELISGAELAGLAGEVSSDYAAHPRVRVSFRAEDGLPDVTGDRALLRDALSNFVLNAVEELERGGGAVEVTLRAVTDGSGKAGVEVACDDDGPGVDEEDLPRLFDPTFSTKSRGSGMGLAAARRAVEEQGGRLFARRSSRGGLHIGFVLPAAAR